MTQDFTYGQVEKQCEGRQVQHMQNGMKKQKNQEETVGRRKKKGYKGKGRSGTYALPRWLLALLERTRERMMGGTETELAWTKQRKEMALQK